MRVPYCTANMDEMLEMLSKAEAQAPVPAASNSTILPPGRPANNKPPVHVTGGQKGIKPFPTTVSVEEAKRTAQKYIHKYLEEKDGEPPKLTDFARMKLLLNYPVFKNDDEGDQGDLEYVRYLAREAAELEAFMDTMPTYDEQVKDHEKLEIIFEELKSASEKHPFLTLVNAHACIMQMRDKHPAYELHAHRAHQHKNSINDKINTLRKFWRKEERLCALLDYNRSSNKKYTGQSYEEAYGLEKLGVQDKQHIMQFRMAFDFTDSMTVRKNDAPLSIKQ